MMPFGLDTGSAGPGHVSTYGLERLQVSRPPFWDRRVSNTAIAVGCGAFAVRQNPSRASPAAELNAVRCSMG